MEYATAGADYVAVNATLISGSGETTQSFSVSVLDDAVYEGDEAFSVVLANPQGDVTVGKPSTTVVRILEDELELPPGPVIPLPEDSLDPAEYGQGYGTDEHYTLLAVTFVGDGVDRLHVQGLDVDIPEEIGVYLNGVLLGHLSRRQGVADLQISRRIVWRIQQSFADKVATARCAAQGCHHPQPGGRDRPAVHGKNHLPIRAHT